MNTAARKRSGPFSAPLALLLSLLWAGAAVPSQAECLPVFTTVKSVPDQPVFTAGGPYSITFKNLGGGSGQGIRNIRITVTGPNPADFPIVDDQITGSTLKPGESAQLHFRFAPSDAGIRSVTFIVTSNACNSPGTYIISGRGLGSAIKFSPSSLDFGDLPTGTPSDPQRVSITNSGTTPLTMGGVSLAGDDPSQFTLVSDTGEATLAPGASRSVTLRFEPTGTGSRSASVSVASSAPGSPHTARVRGTAIFGHIQALAPGGHAVAATGRLTVLAAGPAGPVGTASAIRQVAADGSLSVLEPAGTALVRAPAAAAGAAQIVLDTTRQTLPDGVGLARLLQVETSRSGASAVLALRADNTRGIYRLDGSTLTLLAVLPEPRGRADLAIGGAGQVSYLAPAADGSRALFQSAGGPGVELLGAAQVTVGGTTAGGQSDLTGNDAGGLALIARRADSTSLAVLRQRGATFETVAAAGQVVLRAQGSTATGTLTEVRRPRIGPDGSVVFEGNGSGFTNFYLARPTPATGGPPPLVPLLPNTDWISDPTSFDFDVSASGAVAIRAMRGTPSDSELYYVAPTGGVTTVVAGRQDAQPTGPPAFGPGDRLFFRTGNLTLPADRNGFAPVSLFRFRPGDAAPVGVALPGQAVPGRPGAQLLSVPQPPAVSATAISFTALIGGSEPLPVETPLLLQVPLDGDLSQATLVGAAGAPVTDSGRLAMPRELSYAGDGTLLLGGLLSGGGPVIAPATPPATTASAARTQAVPADAIVPLIATGDMLGPGRVESTLPPLLSLGADRELFVARLSQPDGLESEGLFTASRSKQIDQVAVTRQGVADIQGAVYNGLADTRIFSLSPPSVAADGGVVFKALIDRGTATPRGLFRWSSGGAAATVALGNVALVVGDKLPYTFEHWAAGPGGVAYFQARTADSKARLFTAAGAEQPKPLIQPLLTPVVGGGILTDLTDFALTHSGELFVVGGTVGGSGLYHLTQGALAPVAVPATPVPPRPATPVPPLSDGRGAGLVFAGSFQLLPASSRGDLLFRATVQKPGDTATRRGLFRFRQNRLETLAIESVGVEGERSLTVDSLADSLENESGNGYAVAAYSTAKDGWVIVRSQLDPQKGTITSVVIAQEGKAQGQALRHFAALDAGPLLDREGLPQHSGPVFTINEAGDVAFLASDGKSWGVYQVPARP